jgi:hypothetical protein
LVAAIAGAGIFWFSRSQPPPPPRLVPLTSLPGVEKQPSLSPDGSRVAFSWKGDIYVKQVGAEKLLQITKDRAMDSWPAWFTDSSKWSSLGAVGAMGALANSAGGGKTRLSLSMDSMSSLISGLLEGFVREVCPEGRFRNPPIHRIFGQTLGRRFPTAQDMTPVDPYVRKTMESDSRPFRRLSFERIDPIDRIQGQQSDLVFISFCRSRPHPGRDFGQWLQDLRRLNVACTRARDHLYVSYAGQPSPFLP